MPVVEHPEGIDITPIDRFDELLVCAWVFVGGSWWHRGVIRSGGRSVRGEAIGTGVVIANQSQLGYSLVPIYRLRIVPQEHRMVASAASQSTITPIAQSRPGTVGTLRCDGLDASDAKLLRAMGLRDHARVRLCRVGEPCILQVMGSCGCSCRIGLSRPLAQRVMLSVD
ncbi:MAG: hypothetical protein Tsb0013_11130 [Phycisphaerales bacterium]